MSMPSNGGYKCLCPACGSRMRIRGSAVQTPTYKTMYAQCTNMGCGATYTGALSWEYSLNTPGVEHPRAVLPLAPTIVRREALRSQQPVTNQLDMLDAIAG